MKLRCKLFVAFGAVTRTCVSHLFFAHQLTTGRSRVGLRFPFAFVYLFSYVAVTH